MEIAVIETTKAISIRDPIWFDPLFTDPLASGASGGMQAHTGEAHLEFMAQTLGRGGLRVRVGSATRTVSWSPSGAAAAGGCLLCVVSQAHKVSLRSFT